MPKITAWNNGTIFAVLPEFKSLPRLEFCSFCRIWMFSRENFFATAKLGLDLFTKFCIFHDSARILSILLCIRFQPLIATLMERASACFKQSSSLKHFRKRYMRMSEWMDNILMLLLK